MIPLRDANPTRRLPIVTIALIAACFGVWAYELGLLATGADALDAFVTKWGVVPSEVSAALGHRDFASTPIATLFTSQFLHGGWLHILGNMLYLWIFGNNVEDEFGRLRFLAFYLAGGAIAAILGAYVVLYPRARITSLVFLGFFYQLIDVPAVLVLIFWFVLQLIDGLASLGMTDVTGGVAVFAHIGGFVFGVLVAFLVRTFGRRRTGGGLAADRQWPPATVG